MLRILICEDEKLERQALANLIHTHFAEDLTIAGEAENGRIALEYVEMYRPDIVIMDIQMPVFDGLTVSHCIRRDFPQTEIVISTAYGKFDYAQQAIRAGVFDYLVKPVTPDEFIALMRRLIDKVMRKRETARVRERMGRLGRLARDLVEQELLLKMMRGSAASADEIEHLFSLLNLQGVDFAVGLFRLKMDSDRQQTAEALRLNLKHYFGVVVLCSLVDEVAVLLARPKGRGGNSDLETMIRGDSDEKNVLAQGYSTLHQAPDGILDVFVEARNNLNVSLHVVEGKLEEFRYITELENRLFDRIVCEEVDEAGKILRRLAIVVGKKTSGKSINDYARKLLGWIHGSVDRFFNVGISLSDSQGYQRGLETVTNETSFVVFFNTVITKIVVLISQHKSSANETLVAWLQDYIAEHLSEQLSVGKLAAKVSLSAGHLRKVFRQCTGEGIKEYILRIKMRQAGLLLHDKKMLVKEVSAAVGFMDQNYFSRVFKEYFGVSPREYMNR